VPDWYFFKSREWSNEEEVRIVRWWAGPTIRAFRPTLSGIILGEQMTPANVARVMAWSSTRGESFQVQQARFDRYEGRLTLQTLVR
jgi:hypothetical protein